MRLPLGDKEVEEIPHVMETSEVDLAVLLPSIPLSMDHIPLVLRSIGRSGKRSRKRKKKGKVVKSLHVGRG